MPRALKHPKVFLALSPTATAVALGIREDEVRAGIESGALTVHVMGIKRRILVSEIETWVRSWPQPKEKSR